MKVKQTTFYALWMLRAIYLEENEIVTSSKLSEKEALSQGVLLRILHQLGRGGVLESHQGRGNVCGGFSLKRNMEDITLLEVIELMEGKIDMCQMVKKSIRESDVSMYQIFDRANQCIRKELAGYSMCDVFDL